MSIVIIVIEKIHLPIEVKIIVSGIMIMGMILATLWLHNELKKV